MASAIYLSSYDDGREKFLLTCAQWKICFDLKQSPLTEPRTAIENLLKALLLQHLEIRDFSHGNFDSLKIRGEIPDIRNRNGFGFANCLEILVWHFRRNQQPHFIPIGIENLMKSINDFAVQYTHGPIWYSLREVIDVNDKLEQIISWYFTQIENDPDRKDREIKARIDRLLDTIPQKIALATGDHLFERMNEKNYIINNTEEVKEKYLKYIENECGHIQFEGLFSVIGKGAVTKMVEDSFVQTMLCEKTDMGVNDEIDKRITVFNCLKTVKHLIITGDPGAGKTTLLKSLTVAYAFPERGKNLFNDFVDEELFPVYIRCRDLHEKASQPISEIIAYVASLAEIESEMYFMFNQLVKERLKEGRFILLIDGIDEISSDQLRKQFINQLIRFINANPELKSIIASRDFGVRSADGSLLHKDQFEFFQVSGLSDVDVENLSVKWYKAFLGDQEKGQEVGIKTAKEILKNTNTRVLAQNPLIFTTLLLVRHKNKKLPTTRGALYQETVKLLITGWNVEAHGDILLDYEETEIQLSLVAFELSVKKRQTISDDELRDCLKAARRKIERKVDFSIDDFLWRVEKRSGLLKKVGGSKYEFIHLSFQEFLAAVAMAKEYAIQSNLDDDWPYKKLLKQIHGPEGSLLEKLYDLANESTWWEIHIFLLELYGEEITNSYMDYLLADVGAITIDDRERCLRFLELINKNSEEDDCLDFFGLGKEDINTNDEEMLMKKTVEKMGDTLISSLKYRSANNLGKYLLEDVLIEDKKKELFLHNYLTFFLHSNEMMTVTFRKLFRSKYQIEIIKFIRDKLEEECNPEYLPELVFMLSEICDDIDESWNFTPQSDYNLDIDTFLEKVKREICSPAKITKCLGYIRLISMDYGAIEPQLTIDDKERFFELRNEIRKKIEELLFNKFEPEFFEDLHYFHIFGDVLYVLSYYFDIEIPDHYFQIYLEKWLGLILSKARNNYLFRTSAFLTRMMHPDRNIDLIRLLPNNEELIRNIYEDKESHDTDKAVAAYLGIIIGLKWEKEPLIELLNNTKSTKDTKNKHLFIAKLGDS